MPNTRPTFEGLRRSCKNGRETIIIHFRRGWARCSCRAANGVARIDLDLWQGFGFHDVSSEAAARWRNQHNIYLCHYPRCRHVGDHFNKTTIVFHVMTEHADEWFDKIHRGLMDDDNLVEHDLGCMEPYFRKERRAVMSR